MCEFNSQMKKEIVEEKMHTIKFVTIEWATTIVIWKVNDVVVLKKKILKNSIIRNITINIVDASIHANICHYFVVSWKNFQERDIDCDARDL